jgi:hypothetical protein
MLLQYRSQVIWKSIFGLALAAICSTAAEALPDPKEVLRRLKERMEKVTADTNRYQYTRTNVLELLDSKGKVEERSEKTYLVTLKQGLPRARLIVEDGRVLPESEQKVKTAEEQRLQKTIAQDKNPDYKKPKVWINDDLLGRFIFAVIGRTNVDGRSMFILTYTPKADAPAPKMIDKIINKISGVIWVDEEDSEIARLDIHMNNSVKFWGGILGQLDRFDLMLVRKRSDFGIWFNQLTSGLVDMRTLFSTKRMRIREEAFAFGRREP